MMLLRARPALKLRNFCNIQGSSMKHEVASCMIMKRRPVDDCDNAPGDVSLRI